MPLRYVAAAKPAMSPHTPPPNAITSECLVRLAFVKVSYIFTTVEMHLEVSPAGNTFTSAALTPAALSAAVRVSP